MPISCQSLAKFYVLSMLRTDLNTHQKMCASNTVMTQCECTIACESKVARQKRSLAWRHQRGMHVSEHGAGHALLMRMCHVHGRGTELYVNCLCCFLEAYLSNWHSGIGVVTAPTQPLQREPRCVLPPPTMCCRIDDCFWRSRQFCEEIAHSCKLIAAAHPDATVKSRLLECAEQLTKAGACAGGPLGTAELLPAVDSHMQHMSGCRFSAFWQHLYTHIRLSTHNSKRVDEHAFT